MIQRPHPIDLLFVVAPHSLLLDVAGPAEAFRLANVHLARRGRPARFRLRFVGPEATGTTSVGLTLAGLEPLPLRLSPGAWVILAGQPGGHSLKVTAGTAAITQWLERVQPQRLLTICSGALLAARAGLLANRRCTTHHELLEDLRALAPRAKVIDNRVFVVDGPVASSAGITAGIDLALHLVAGECGDSLATAVAEDMVVYLRRSQRDAEPSPFLAHRGHPHAAVHRVQDAIGAEPDRDWDMAALAAVGHVTERHLLRLFTAHAGVSPLGYLREIRLERARQAMERGSSVTQAAELAGFSSGLQLRRAWRGKWGGPPRTHFGVRPGSDQGQNRVRPGSES